MVEGLPLKAVEFIRREALMLKSGNALISTLVDLCLVEGSDDSIHLCLMNIINHHSFNPRILHSRREAIEMKGKKVRKYGMSEMRWGEGLYRMGWSCGGNKLFAVSR